MSMTRFTLSSRSASWVRPLSLMVLMASAWTAHADVLPRLPALGLAPDAVTVSGLSSGAYMAGQFGIAYSGSLSGSAVLAGGPYGCSRGSVSTAMFNCSCPAEKSAVLDLVNAFPGLGCYTFSPEVYRVFSERAIRGNQGAIDDPANLQRHRVWLFSGGKDPVVHRQLVSAAELVYRSLGVPATQIHREDVADAGHGFPSPQATQACSATRTPFLTQCHLDGAEQALKWLYPDMASAVAGQADTGRLRQFRQAPYGTRGEFNSLDSTGWVYVPKACETAGAGCRLHVAFHGCEQGQSFKTDGQRFGLQFVQGAGYNPWAEAGRIVVLYPQVKPSTQGDFYHPYRFNPKGCWDFWGYTEKYAAGNSAAPNFAKRSAPQMKAVKAMIDDLLRAP